jgi:hypothetical protein
MHTDILADAEVAKKLEQNRYNDDSAADAKQAGGNAGKHAATNRRPASWIRWGKVKATAIHFLKFKESALPRANRVVPGEFSSFTQAKCQPGALWLKKWLLQTEGTQQELLAFSWGQLVNRADM